MFKYRGSYRKKLIYYSIVASIITIFFYNVTLTKSPVFIKREEILGHLHAEIAQNFTTSAREYCDYKDLVKDESVLSLSMADSDLNEDEGQRINDGGVYAPRDCKPRYSVAIIIPYKDKVEQLRAILIYLHQFLQKQLIHYRIYVVEQVDSHPYHPSKLANIGALAAMKAGYPCLILHDVDLLPLNPANVYACTKQPRNMFYEAYGYRMLMSYAVSSSAVAILGNQFKSINGLSTRYYDGWDPDNNDLKTRLRTQNLHLCRFDPDISRYYVTKGNNVMWEHKRINQEDSTKAEMFSDGLNTLRYTEVATVLHPLFTHIMIDLEYQKPDKLILFKSV